MHFSVFAFALSGILAAPSVVGLGSACSSELAGGTAAPGAPYWLENITHQGYAPYAPNPSTYAVYRNVKNYGAVGDGVADDTAAINAAISSGERCGEGCPSSTTTPALVYFPSGTYLVSTPILAYYYTALIGDARTPPTILASANFSGLAVIDADPYDASGANWYVNQDNFYRSVRNVVIDLTQTPYNATSTGIHWQVSQSTSLVNVVVNMSTENGTAHRGLFMEDGSGGFMGDLIFNGGQYGMWVGNQQFTVRNVTVNNANTAIYTGWNWDWTFQRIVINNCQVGFEVVTGSVGAIGIIDAVATNTPVFFQSTEPSDGTEATGSIVLNNIHLDNVPVAVGVVNGTTVLEGGTTTIESWGQGNAYAGTDPNATFAQGNIYSAYKDPGLLDTNGMIFSKGHPQYADYAVDQIMSVRSQGAVGDGETDDTDAINAVFAKYAGCYIIFFDAGVYKVTDTIYIPAGSRVVGEAWSVIMGSGSEFDDETNPRVVVQVGAEGSFGYAEISDIVFTTQGPTHGAIVVEWNVHDPVGVQGAAGMWDSHIRLGGAMGTNLELAECPAGSEYSDCTASFLALHITAGATAYLEGTWVWLADHDLDGDGSTQLTIFSGRGILSNSAGPVWMIGTCEHHVMYQYSLVGASNHYMGLIQTETPYYQPDPAPPAPFEPETSYGDPSYENGMNMAWAVWLDTATNVIIFGAGHYSFFQNYTQTCLANETCQAQIVNTDLSLPTIYSLSTVGATYQLSVEENGIIYWGGDADGFASTVTVWSPLL
ncbi:glycoside hydrolase family 55 protein [Coniophora puteana RWD-64-598 SS2]|uniref:Glycoside hydrolase family 55 protein n=1 Tax=Coniophora puteana (strain RWD-64-598) TaxID=741705 RepID=A0A5M3N3M0_CONPW|nr:glycoside hydrolase family 55 protein [Coniophora puteana RWD-64-598 SS2]EIW85435.1 glycoside hydrolase family 55 protein [Coniophora puteana RWD-64-598 SS2]